MLNLLAVRSLLVEIPITACIDRELLWLLARSLFVQQSRGARPRTLGYVLKKKDTGLFGNFSQHGGGGVFPIPKSENQKNALKSP